MTIDMFHNCITVHHDWAYQYRETRDLILDYGEAQKAVVRESAVSISMQQMTIAME